MKRNKVYLWWNQQGRTGCADHIPSKLSDTWMWEKWEPVPMCNETQDLCCEVCGCTIPELRAMDEEKGG